jgi:uncharacterized protein (TIGR03435 family)
MMNFIRRASVFALAAFAVPHAHAQLQPAAAAPVPAYKFEVASIKLNTSGDGGITTHSAVDGWIAENITLERLIMQAYGIQNYQIIGGPGWQTSERYNVDAKMDAALADAFQKLSPDDRKVARQQMLQDLLADRFKLVAHRESREFSVFMLVIAKTGSKLVETKTPAANGISIHTSQYGKGPVTMTAEHTGANDLAMQLFGFVNRPVLDKTGLTQRFDFVLRFQPDYAVPSRADSDPNPEPAPSLFTAIQEQLGLKLESGKGQVDIVVIDHVDHPTGN